MTCDGRRPTGRDLAAERVRASLRQADVAAAMGLSRVRICQLEAQQRVTATAAERYLAAVERAARERYG